MVATKQNILSQDLDYILENTLPLWNALRDQRLFITGGTGFFGCWLLESFLWANTTLNLNARALVLTRNIAQFARKCPHIFGNPALDFHEGDVANFSFPQGQFSHVIHAATEASVSLNENNPDLMLSTIIEGTKHTLEFSRQCGARRFLFTSSGAIYGKQPSHISSIHEEDLFCPNESTSAYAKGKREAEKICANYASYLDIKIARCFAFVGPYLPLDSNFAIGNFINDGLNGRSIVVKSDGSPYRSYLYASDLTIALWTILFRGDMMRPYNVGSDAAISIKDLAHLVASTFKPKLNVHVEKETSTCSPERYVPNTHRMQEELKIRSRVDLRRAIELTKEWHSLLM